MIILMPSFATAGFSSLASVLDYSCCQETVARDCWTLPVKITCFVVKAMGVVVQHRSRRLQFPSLNVWDEAMQVMLISIIIIWDIAVHSFIKQPSVIYIEMCFVLWYLHNWYDISVITGGAHLICNPFVITRMMKLTCKWSRRNCQKLPT